MADLTEGISGMIPKVSGAQILNGVTIALVCVLVLGTIGFFLWRWFKAKKYSEYRIVIYEKDATGNVHEYYDRGGIFLDKRTNFKLLFLEKFKTGLNPNNPPYTIAKDKKGRLVKTIYLRRTGVSNFRFIKMALSDEGTLFTIGEEDANWYAHEMEKIDRMVGKESLWNKIAPFAVMIICLIVIMIVMITLFNKLDGFSKAAESLTEASKIQLEISKTLLNISARPNMNSAVPVIIAGGKG